MTRRGARTWTAARKPPTGPSGKAASTGEENENGANPAAPDWAAYRRLWSRLLGRTPQRHVLDWWGPLAFAIVGGLMRLWRLGTPDSLVFDESYYVKQAYSMTQHGVELRVDKAFQDSANNLFVSGTPDVFTRSGDLVVHPPLGKWLIALGESVFGVENPWAWRLLPWLAGTLSILILGRVARRLTGSATWGTVAAGLLAFEGTQFVHSRTGVLDIFVEFFALAAFACLLLDRDRSRESLAWALANDPSRSDDGNGPVLGWRPWRWAAGALLGCLVATKWSGLVFVAVFGLMTVLWDLNARRRAGIRSWFTGGLLRDAPPAFLAIVGSALAVYALSWSGWFFSSLGYDRHWAAAHPARGLGHLVPSAFRSWIAYHQEMWHLNTVITSDHPYKTKPWGWFLQIRPTLFFKRETKGGSNGCEAVGSTCIETVNSIGTLTVWWLGLVSVFVLIVLWIGLREHRKPFFFQPDWRIGAALSGIVAGYLPWFFSGDRTIYSFYTVAFVPFVVLAIVLVLDYVAGPEPTGRRHRAADVIGVSLVAVGLIWMIYFWPVYTAQMIPKSAWLARGWLPGWR